MVETIPGVMSSFTLQELTEKILGETRNAPQLNSQIATLLNSLVWGTAGLAVMGYSLGFILKDPETPKEYPKMLYLNDTWRIADNAGVERELVAEGYSTRVVKLPHISEPAPVRPIAPTISIPIPTGPSDDC